MKYSREKKMFSNGTMVRSLTLVAIIVCFTGSFIVITFIKHDTEKLVFASDERLLDQIVRRKLLETSFSNIGPYPGNINNHRVEVIKGTPTGSIDDYPYTVSLLNRDSRNKEWHVCGGTLIARNIVLSAAHCRDHVKSVTIGEHIADHDQRRNLFGNDFEEKHKSFFRSGWRDTQYQRRKTIALVEDSFVVHPDYNPATGENDFMLIHLGENFDGTPFPELNSNENVPNAYGTDEEKKVVVLGWGMTINDDGNSGSDVLLKANLDYVNNYQCGFAYGQAHIKTNMLCAHSNSGRDACNGDSGGPLIAQNDDGPAKDLLVGVVSWGAACGSSKYPGVYARVSTAFNWINDVTCNQLNPNACERNGRISAFRAITVAVSPVVVSPRPSLKPSDSPTVSPTALPAWCQDFGGRFYITKNSQQIRDCTWVGSAKLVSTKWYRCRWFKFYCPRTCNTCQD